MKNRPLKILWPNKVITNVLEGEDWFLKAKEVGLIIPTGCLTGSCGACEIDVDGETTRPCIEKIKKKKNNLMRVDLTKDPFW